MTTFVLHNDSRKNRTTLNKKLGLLKHKGSCGLKSVILFFCPLGRCFLGFKENKPNFNNRRLLDQIICELDTNPRIPYLPSR